MKRFAILILLVLPFCSCTNDENRIKAVELNEDANQAIENEDYSLAILSAKESLDIFNSIEDTIGMIESNYLITRALAFSEDFKGAMAYGEKGSKLSKVKQNYAWEYKLNNTLSYVYFMLGKGFDETLAHQERQMFVVDQIEDDRAKANVYNNYGYDATVAGTVPLSDLIRVMEIANNHYATIENTDGRWYTLMNLTWQYRLINNLAKSEEYGRLAVRQAEIDQDRHAIIEANTNLGETLLALDKIYEAKPLYEDILDLSGQQNDRDKYVFDVYYSRYLWKTGKKDDAIAVLEEAVGFLESDEIFYEMLGRAFLAEYYYSSGNLEGATEQIKRFKNPRATFYSQESDVLAGIIDAKLVALSDRDSAIVILENKIEELKRSDAKFLIKKVIDIKSQL